MRSKNICIVGVGLMGKTHLDIYKKIGVEGNIILVDTDQKRLEEIAGKYAVSFSPSFEEATRQKSIDICDICVPTKYHLQFIKKAINANVNILVEKPAVLNYEETNELTDLLLNYHKVFMCAFVERYFEPYMLAKQFSQKGSLIFFLFERFGGKPKEGSWYADRQLSGGVLLDLGVHDIDFFCNICTPKKEEEVHAFNNNGGISTILNGSVSGIFNCGWTLPITNKVDFYNAFKLITDRGIFTYDSMMKSICENGEVIKINEDRYPQAYRREIETFLSRVDNFKPEDNERELNLIRRTMEIVNKASKFIN